MTQHLPSDDEPSIRHQIDLICDRFESKIQAGGVVVIGDFLNDVPAEHRERLFQELLVLFIDYAGRGGPPIDANSLRKNFPEFNSVIEVLLRGIETDISIDPEATQLDSAKFQVSAGDFQTLDNKPSSSEPTSASVNVTTGSRLKYVGDYQIINEIARGGMGIVYRARQTSLNRIVALKMILSGELAGDQEVSRFRSEAEAAANLNHPGIVPIFEVGQHQEQHYFSMGLIDGPSLSDVLRDGPMQHDSAARLMRQVADAIHYAHTNGVIHRDLKPGNILLDKQGDPHVTDFGLAKRMSSASELTTTGQIIGTPAYMPPEQARGDLNAIGPTSDIYSLGAILYAMLSGRPPHNAGNAIETLRQVLEVEPLGIRSLNPAIPKDLETICATCLNKEPSRRYQTAGALSEELGRYINGEPIRSRPVSRSERAYRWAKRNPAIAWMSAAVLLLTVTLAIGGPFAAVAQSRLKRAAQSNEQRANVLADRERQSREAVEARERQLAAAKVESDHSLYARTISLSYQQWQSGNLTSAEDLLASTPISLRGFEWNYIDQLCHTELQQFGGMKEIPQLVAMAADGVHVLAAESGRTPLLYLWTRGTNLPIETRSQRALAVSRSGEKLAVVDSQSEFRIQIVELVTGKLICEVMSPTQVTSYASFGGVDDSLLAVVGQDKSVRIWDLNSGKEQVKIDQAYYGYLHPIALSGDGRTVAWRRSDNGEITVHEAVKGRRRFEGLPATRMATRMSPIVFAPDSLTFAVGGYGQVELRRSDDGTQTRHLEGLSGYVKSLAYSPNGRLLAVTCQDDSIHVFDVARNRELTRITGHKNSVAAVAFDSTGDQIVSGGEDENIKLWDVWSGDRKSLTRNGEPRDELSRPSQSRDFVTEFQSVVSAVRFAKDGSLLFATSHDKEVHVFDTATGEKVRQWTDFGGPFSAVDYDPSGGTVIAGVGSFDDNSTGPIVGKIAAWDYSTGKELWQSEIAPGPISGIQFLGDGSRVAVSIRSDFRIRSGLMVFASATGDLVWEFESRPASVRDMAVSEDGSWIATVGNVAGIRINDAETGKQMRIIGNQNYSAVTISRDGNRLAVGDDKGSVQLYEIESGEMLWSRLRHSGKVTDVAFADRDTRIISISHDGTTQILDSKYGNLILSLEDNGEAKLKLAVSPDASLIAATSYDSNIVLRRVAGANRSEPASEAGWITLFEDDFSGDELGAHWRVEKGKWAQSDGVLHATFEPSAQLISNTLVPSSVEVSYDVRIQSPMIVETKLVDKSGENSMSALHIGVQSSPFNFKEKGVSIISRSAGSWKEVASRREGSFHFDVDRTYNIRTRRIGRVLEMYIDDELYRRAEVAVDVPIPWLTLQLLFGKPGDQVSIDNFVVKIPPRSVLESKAIKLVSDLFDSLELTPLVIAKIGASDSTEFADLDLRRMAVQLATAWPQDDAFLIRRTLELATWNERTADEYRTLYRTISSNIPVQSEASYRAVAAAALRAGDRSETWNALKQASQLYENKHGSKHPIDKAIEGLLYHKSGNAKNAQDTRRQIEHLMLANHWKQDNLAKAWAKVCEETIELPELNPVSKTLAARVWEIDQSRILHGNIQPLASSLAENAVFEQRRSADDSKYKLSINRDAWLSTEKITSLGRSHEVRLVRTSVSVKNESRNTIVSSRYTCEPTDNFFLSWSQSDTFQAATEVEADQWKLTRRTLQCKKVFNHGEAYNMELDGWEPLDQRVEKAIASGDPTQTMAWLTIAMRPQEAFEAAKKFVEKSNTPYAHAAKAEMAGFLFDADAMSQAASEAINLDPMVTNVFGRSYLRVLASRQLIAEKPTQLRANISVSPPTFFRKAPLSLLANGDAAVAAWQVNENSLVGISLSQGDESLDVLVDWLIKRYSSLFNTKILEISDRTVAGFPARQVIHSARGIGRFFGGPGPMTTQRIIFVKRPADVVVLLVSAYDYEFSARDSEFEQLLDTLILKPN